MIYLQKCKISIFFVIFAQLCPLCGVHAHALLEGTGECTVAAVAKDSKKVADL